MNPNFSQTAQEKTQSAPRARRRQHGQDHRQTQGKRQESWHCPRRSSVTSNSLQKQSSLTTLSGTSWEALYLWYLILTVTLSIYKWGN